MATDKKVQIFLSTYNGEKFLREQLDSIVSQSVFDKIKVLIRDDGSTDGTCGILREYEEKFGFEVLFGENIGVNKSMLLMFQNCDRTCDYYAVCDQDDVWTHDKVERAVNRLDELSGDRPLLYASRSCITDAGLKPIGMAVVPKKGTGFFNAAFENVCPGHTQVFNNCLMDILSCLTDSEGIYIIDAWIYLTAAALGTVVFDEHPSVYHRQHGGNAVGYSTNFFGRMLGRFRRLSLKKKDPTAIQLSLFYKTYSCILPDEYAGEVRRFFDSQKRLSAKLKYACSMKFFKQSALDMLIFRAMYILGKYDL